MQTAFLVDRVKTFVTCSLITIQNLVVVSHTVCACRGPRNWDAGGPAPWDGGVPAPKTRYCPVYRMTKTIIMITRVMMIPANDNPIETLPYVAAL